MIMYLLILFNALKLKNNSFFLVLVVGRGRLLVDQVLLLLDVQFLLGQYWPINYLLKARTGPVQIPHLPEDILSIIALHLHALVIVRQS